MQLIKNDPRGPGSRISPSPNLPDKFQELRREAERWHTQRTAYMLERLQAGRHPDTDEAFWNG